MWPIVMALLRRNAVYFTLPFAAVVGFIGYNVENLISDKYTPYSQSIQDNRADRLADDDILANAAKVDKLKLKENVLGRNLSPSLQAK
ncbi:small integral membrane protein 12-A [Bradysia coprophila]|uniref:small integral membrane protein 12-A n=1 Tax=Bradysia coprophila TaxID=38358 RepID=UPI00187DA453|nr:small integral membrane protein 12-A [Bradysia coprophila]